MIVNHETGQQISLSRLLALFPSVAAAGNPLIGTNGIRGPWSSPPTDAELRTVGYSYVVETEQPTSGEGEQVRAGPLELSDDAWRQTWIVESIPVYVPESVETHKVLIAMDAAGILQQVEALVTAANGPLQIAFNRAPMISRNSTMVAGMAMQIWPDDTAEERSARLDALFIAAEELQT